MQLIQVANSILLQLTTIIEQMEETDFTQPCPSLANSSIGQHIRHTLEFFLCLETGCKNGVVNYDNRAHDKLIESDKFIALATIERIKSFIAGNKEDFNLKLQACYQQSNSDFVNMNTNYFRELTYNIEHAVHHMAIIKIGIREIAPSLTLPADFGIAASTIRHQHSQLATSR
ncbi:MAG TPA: hypothetical protein DIW27_09735 [Cytophagales bacterium]|nr:hypothetical protein [Cytophagales bacterium]